MDVDVLVNRFASYLRDLGLRQRSRAAYCNAAARFLVSDYTVEDFLASLSPSVCSVASSALCRLLTYLGDTGLHPEVQQRLQSIETPRVARYVQNRLLRHRIQNCPPRPTTPVTDFDRLWNLAKMEAGSTYLANQLLRPALVLGLLCGLRRGDLLAARWEWVNWEQRVLMVPDPKGGRPYAVPLSPLASEKLLYLDSCRGDDPGDHILQGRRKGSKTNRTTLTAELKLIGVTPHGLRRGFATGMLSKGVPAPTVAKLMNHKSPETTFKNYFEPDKEVLRDAVSRLSEAPED